jgi:hypothetical protein
MIICKNCKMKGHQGGMKNTFHWHTFDRFNLWERIQESMSSKPQANSIDNFCIIVHTLHM